MVLSSLSRRHFEKIEIVYGSISTHFFSFTALSLPLPKAGEFQIKEVDDKNILYVIHLDDKGHISNSLIKLIQYYLLNESKDYQVVFPQLSR